MQCNCGGAMRARRIDFLGRWGGVGPRVLVTDVRVWECESCGVQTLDSTVVDEVQCLIQEGRAGTTGSRA